MFKRRAVEVCRNSEAKPRNFRPDYSRTASLLKGFIDILRKACGNRGHNNNTFVKVRNKHTRKKNIMKF